MYRVARIHIGRFACHVRDHSCDRKQIANDDADEAEKYVRRTSTEVIDLFIFYYLED